MPFIPLIIAASECGYLVVLMPVELVDMYNDKTGMLNLMNVRCDKLENTVLR